MKLILKNMLFVAEEDSKLKEKSSKKITKRSQSYPPTEYPSYMGYYKVPPEDLNGISPHATTYPYDHQIPLIWMSVQQCANGYILTPVTPDVYSTNYSSYFYQSSMSHHPAGYSLYSPTPPIYNDVHNNATIVENGDKNGDNLNVSELKSVLPDETATNHLNNSVDDYASEETAFGSPNSESL